MAAETANLDPGERAKRGKAARERVPRSSLGDHVPGPDRPDPIELLESQAANRVPELVPIRYGRMVASPFSFYRGADLIMATDVGARPHTDLLTQLCGDAHLSNFGLFASPERRLVFDLNDFDETLPGPFEWDVKRLAASLTVAARESAISQADRRDIVAAAANEYRTAIRGFAEMRTLDVWYARADVDDLVLTLQGDIDPKGMKALNKVVAKTRSRDSVQAFSKFARDEGGEPRIVSDPPLIVPIAELLPDADEARLRDQLGDLLKNYSRSLPSDRRHLLQRYHVVDIARKVVGVGSVGTRAWIMLLLGRDGSDPLFLQAKEAQPSVLDGLAGRSGYANQGERVVAGQRLMQAASDIFLGWDRVHGVDGATRDFYVRQLRDWKGAADPTSMTPANLNKYGRICAWTLARAHARAGDPIAIGSYLGRSEMFDLAIARFGEAYADQNERDHEALVRAVKDGRLAAEPDL
jgi:uncharacterized protein (DUF2252 family)